MNNMEFGMPRAVGSLYYNAGTVGPLSAIVKFQGKNLGDEGGDEDESMSFALVPSATTNSDRLGPSLFGEEIRSARALLQKLSFVGRQYAATGTPDLHIAVPHFFPPPFTYTHSPVQVLPGTALTPPWTWYGHFAACFACVRGSTRYKTLTMGGTVFDQVVPVTGSEYVVANTNLASGVGTGTTNSFTGSTFCGLQTQNGGGSEFVVPGYQATMYVNPCNFGWTNNLTGSTQRIDICNIMATSPAQIPTWYLIGAGPDISLFRFRRVPPMIAAS